MQASSSLDTRQIEATHNNQARESGFIESQDRAENTEHGNGLGIQLIQSPVRHESDSNFDSLPAESADYSASDIDHAAIPRANLATYTLNTGSDVSALIHATDTLPDGLHVQTDLPRLNSPPIMEHGVEEEDSLQRTASNTSLQHRALGHRNIFRSSVRSASPASLISSPLLTAMGDMTPLPSPTMGVTKDPLKVALRTRSRASSGASTRESTTSNSTTATTVQSSPPRRKKHHVLRQPMGDSMSLPAPFQDTLDRHSKEKSRSVSDYFPPALAVLKTRPIVVSGSIPPPNAGLPSTLHREEYLAEQRGVSTDIKSATHQQSHGATVPNSENDLVPVAKRPKTEVYNAVSIASGHQRSYRSIRFLGQGTFSKVYLALQQVESIDDGVDYSVEGTSIEGVKARSRRFVAVKVIEHGPAGGADEERIEVSLKREVELLRSINHPSLVHLRALGAEETRALLVLNFCPGGDLFDLASTRLHLLVPTLVQRIFAELVSAVSYLHQNLIVHRDIKLENVLLNIPGNVLPEVSDWRLYDRSVVTLTDLGLGKRIPEPPESPLLTTRCGSDDYAAPEIHLGQPYDGRQTDAWALGVTLYALMEGRLPFDPLPGARGDPVELRRRTPHRIARCEWAWCKFGDEDGDWDAEKGKDYLGANICVDALLKRTSRRKDLGTIGQMDWVRNGIRVPGGLTRDEEAI